MRLKGPFLDLAIITSILLVLTALFAITMGVLFIGDFIAIEYGINSRLVAYLVFCAIFLMPFLRESASDKQAE